MLGCLHPKIVLFLVLTGSLTGKENANPTIVWTKGEGFPLDLLKSRCSNPCGELRVQIVFEALHTPAYTTSIAA
jgi:hypothetical protein